MRAFWAKVVGRSDADFCGGWTTVGGKGVVVFGACCDANGFAFDGPDFVDVENGFWVKLLDDRVELNRLLPRSCGSCSFSWFTLLCTFDFSTASFGVLIPRKPLIVPSFLLHAFLLQLKIYSFRSWPGNLSGRSPFSCNNSVIMLLQTLHLASSTEGPLASLDQFCWCG